jgi:hypothetical protein
MQDVQTLILLDKLMDLGYDENTINQCICGSEQ